ncbi:MAG: hypothetical protein CM15mV5_0400 [uncultured marine virus]|nr:MAG: hypothetical protein CM15mV5_0400 [uncultured marine virus]
MTLIIQFKYEYDPDGTFNITGMPLRGTGKDIRMLDANGSSAPAVVLQLIQHQTKIRIHIKNIC